MVMGSKIFIRIAEKDDLNKLHNFYNDFELKELNSFKLEFISFSKFVRDFEDNNSKKSIDFTILERQNKEIVGCCRLMDLDFINKKGVCSVCLGNSPKIDKEWEAETIKLLMKYAFDELNLNRLGVWVFDFNKRAIRSYKKCGMKVEGIMREGIYRDGKYHDVYFMGILRSEYQELKNRGEGVCLEENM